MRFASAGWRDCRSSASPLGGAFLLSEEKKVGESKKKLWRRPPALAGDNAHKADGLFDTWLVGKPELERIGRGVWGATAIDEDHAVAEGELEITGRVDVRCGELSRLTRGRQI